MTKGYLRDTMICVKQKATNGVFRLKHEKARKLIATGEWSFTTKSAWKSSGRKYYEQTQG
jgi:hypothetical protein